MYGDREYKAVWRNDGEYVINYAGLEGAVFAEGETNPVTYNKEEEAIKLYNPTKEGATFTGWTCEALDITVPTTLFEIPTGTEGDLTIVANWHVVDEYTITYNGLEGATFAEGEENPTTYKTSEEIIALYNPTREDAEFTGWTCEELNVTEPTKDFEIPAGTDGDLTIVANWNEGDEFNITYEGLEGAVFEEGKENPATYVKSDTDIVLFDPTKDGYTFTGWTCEKLGKTVPETPFAIPAGTEGDLTIVANWDEAGKDKGKVKKLVIPSKGVY